MSVRPEVFLDTNILIYAFAADDPRSETAEALLAAGGVTGVQALNEFVNVSRRKLGRNWAEIEAALEVLKTLLSPPVPVTEAVHRAALVIARDHSFSFYDALIVAAAVEAGCTTLYSEDMQHGRQIGGLSIRNPFA